MGSYINPLLYKYVIYIPKKTVYFKTLINYQNFYKLNLFR